MTWELVPESTPGPTRVKSPWWILLLLGLVTSLTGLALMIWPFFAASRILAMLVGAAFVVNGVGALLGFRGRAFALPGSILLIVCGIIALAFPDFVVTVLVSFVAVMMIAVGAIWLLISVRLRGVGARLGSLSLIIPGVILALGLAALGWPAVALSLAAVAAGLVSLFVGVTLIWGGVRLRAIRGVSRA